jgi:aquaporin Z
MRQALARHWPEYLMEAAELGNSFHMMLVVLIVSNRPRAARFTPLFAGSLVATYILVEAPQSGMSMIPARTLDPGVWAQVWDWLLINFIAPPLGMLLAAELYWALRGPAVLCAKLHHQNAERCIFRCGYADPRLNVVEPVSRVPV